MTRFPQYVEPPEVTAIKTAHERYRDAWLNVQARRYNPFWLGVYIFVVVAVWLTVTVYVFRVSGDWLIALIPFLSGLCFFIPIGWWCLTAFRVELTRLESEKEQYYSMPDLPAVPEASEPLRVGLVQNGKVVPPVHKISERNRQLRDACLTLIREGRKRGSYTRSTLAEGEGAPMDGSAWDMASPWLQERGWFVVVAGRGLVPAPKTDLDIVEQLIEVAE